MRIHNLYEDADGESHFRDIEIDWVEETPSGKMSKLPATGVVFRETTIAFLGLRSGSDGGMVG
jgi:hypothetical protein